MSDALDAIRALYDTGKYSDMKIRCEDKVFDVHRAVICMRSPVIAAAMDDDRWEEAAKGEYHMSDDELPVVEAMIHYLYLRTYDDQVTLAPKASGSNSQLRVGKAKLPPSPPTPESKPKPKPEPEFELDTWGGRGNLTWNNRVLAHTGGRVPEVTPVSLPSSLLFNAKVYIIADKYMIPALKSLACEKCSKSLEEHWNTSEFSAAAELLWENTPSSDMLLRDSVVTAAASHINVLLNRGEFVEFMSTHGDFAVEVLKRMKGRNNLVVTGNSYPDTTPWDSKFKKKARRSAYGL
ncbi:hypothetical protein OCU04_004475 [Sclerotinia nivalis]|uniref:BTB domain-containing protein n=1 Tax=Sclerotinia nivalis TaxID=352851 RepID=A0A9X0DNJ6_9HELO|nr:hypothetical protein OCU04_004475 [Sclerotinia nivalis]